VAPAVVASLSALDLPETDLAAARLAERYAALIDRAAFAGSAAERVLRQAAATGDVELADQVDALRKLLGEQAALDRLGARLEAVLDAIGGTAKARARTGNAAPGNTGPSRLDRLRSGRVS
jgi:hypothetical protein